MIYCVTVFGFYGYKDKPMSNEMWRLFPLLLGVASDPDLGFRFENLHAVVVAIKNYVAHDPDGIL